MNCTFFGHRNVPQMIAKTLRSTLINLIENDDVNLFFVGNQGAFDTIVYRTLNELSTKYPIKYYVVFAYYPKDKSKFNAYDFSDTIIPEGIETVPKRFAINYRNKWMIEQSDFVVTYVEHDIGSGAAQFKKQAKKCGKKVIELYRFPSSSIEAGNS